MYSVQLNSTAVKDLDNLPNKEIQKIKEKILMLESNPRPIGSLKLTNMEGYRIRIGNYRALYNIDDKKREVLIFRIRHRKEAYH